MAKKKMDIRNNTTVKSRSFMITMHIKNFLNLGISEEEYKDCEKLAEILMALWSQSGKNRICAVVVALSADGTYHVHLACYSENSTTINCVAKIFGNAHVEIQLAGKKKLLSYLLKEGEFAEEGEKVLYSIGLENLQDSDFHRRTDLEEIKLMIEAGCTPKQIFNKNCNYRKFEKMVLSMYRDNRLETAPLVKECHHEYHFGDSGTGKSFTYVRLVEAVGQENVYMCNDFQNGGMDGYMEAGAPEYLFLDELKPGADSLSYRQLLNITDVYSSAQTHARFHNAYNLWNSVIITSIYPIEELWKELVPEERRKTDTLQQLLRRFETIVYHFKIDDNFAEVSVKASDYKGLGQMYELARQKEKMYRETVVLAQEAEVQNSNSDIVIETEERQEPCKTLEDFN